MEGPVLYFAFSSNLRIFFEDLFREYVDFYMMLTALCYNLQDQFFFSCKLCSIIVLTLHCPLLVIRGITARFLQWQLLVPLSGEMRWHPYVKFHGKAEHTSSHCCRAIAISPHRRHPWHNQVIYGKTRCRFLSLSHFFTLPLFFSFCHPPRSNSSKTAAATASGF